ncbi:YitT family protein [Tepidibacillus fermentans]|uniref:Putative 5xTM membrane YitT family protein n=1 Tax=Tepidibacillus fermentans TaxID=1281767 RepID=A0A4R3K541_9BACI|nr:YitT family protein [Tepidibacillus fermentans]TCS77835.1 putative 5xTM membrane YitT family protein [Tepidibacillus fermentans]
MLFIHRVISILFGSLILSIGINFFIIPFHILDGGVIGLALIVNYLTGYKVGLMIILFSFPIYLLAWFKSRPFFYNSLHGLLISSFFIDIVYPYTYYFHYYIHISPLESSILGGLLVGAGIGIMLRADASTGGLDLLAQFLAKHFSINVGLVIFLFDATIISLGGLLISKNNLILSFITVLSVGIATSLLTWNKEKHEPC